MAAPQRPVFDLPETELHNIGILNDIIAKFESAESALKDIFPGLLEALRKVKDDSIHIDDLARALLKSISSRPAYIAAFNELDDQTKKRLQEFLDGKSPHEVIGPNGSFSIPLSPAAKKHFVGMEEGVGNSLPLKIYEDKEKTALMRVFQNTEFKNWGLTVDNTPAWTFVPTTVLGLQNLVQAAKQAGKRVRASGYRHTWSNMYSANDEFLVSMLSLSTATAVPDPTSLLPSRLYPGNEFKVIELQNPVPVGDKAYARIGAAVTNEEFRRWSIGNGWTLPLNVIMVEITLGGSNNPICHGAGLKHKTLSDLVRKIEYVDANGNHQAIDDARLLKAAAGSLGLLGVVTHITFELDKMTYAVMKPEKQSTYLTIPPPPGYDVPAALRENVTEAELETALTKFTNDANNAYYSEWFWFPYQKQSFINVWNNEPASPTVTVNDYPSYAGVFSQWIQGWLGGVLNDDSCFRDLPGHWQATLLGTFAMRALPGAGPDIITYLIDALHFRRGVQNMRVRDIELQIPIPLDHTTQQPMWEIVQRAWWDAITLVYQDKTAPMRIALELRIMSGSDIVLAPQRDNWGTASIEVLTSMAAAAEEGIWEAFVQKVVNQWATYKDSNGALLNVRPHWAKEWDAYQFRGEAWSTYTKNNLQDSIAEFKALLAEIGNTQGWTLDDLRARFSVQLLDEIIFA